MDQLTVNALFWSKVLETKSFKRKKSKRKKISKNRNTPTRVFFTFSLVYDLVLLVGKCIYTLHWQLRWINSKQNDEKNNEEEEWESLRNECNVYPPTVQFFVSPEQFYFAQFMCFHSYWFKCRSYQTGPSSSWWKYNTDIYQ